MKINEEDKNKMELEDILHRDGENIYSLEIEYNCSKDSGNGIIEINFS